MQKVESCDDCRDCRSQVKIDCNGYVGFVFQEPSILLVYMKRCDEARVAKRRTETPMSRQGDTKVRSIHRLSFGGISHQISCPWEDRIVQTISSNPRRDAQAEGVRTDFTTIGSCNTSPGFD
jgi:hypothetical protein